MENTSPHNNNSWNKIILNAFLFSIVCLFGIVVYLFILSNDLPSLDELQKFNPEQVTKIISSDGTVIKKLYTHKRDMIQISSIPINLRSALLCMEDRDFYDHNGINIKGIIRAIVINLASFSTKQGASTLTQQLARNMYNDLSKTYKIGAKKTIKRKLKEFITALKIEQTYTKSEILELYLNSVYFGHGNYGVQSASIYYFGKDASDLSLDECAILVGLLPAPARYSPRNHPERIDKRKKLVLRIMNERGYISDHQYNESIIKPLPEKNYDYDNSLAPHFSEYIRRKLELIDEDLNVNLYKDGLYIQTTLNSKIQKILDKNFKKVMDKNQKVFNSEILDSPRILKAIHKEYNIDIDSLKNILKNNLNIPKNLRKKLLVQGSAIVLNPKNGNILGMIGGRTEDNYIDHYNRATQSKRQPGSVFKPFVYMGGIKDYDSKHPFTVAYQLSNSTVPIPLVNGDTWNPRNFDGKEDGKDMTLREGLTYSTNLIAAGLIAEMDNGPDSVKKIAQSFGISTPIYPGEALSLGATDVIPLEITSAYSAIANNGILVEPTYINKIENSLGRVLMNSDLNEEFAEKDEGVIYIIRDMMKDVINYGTGKIIKKSTTNNLHDYGEEFDDVGFDGCPDRYEDGKGGCVWRWKKMQKGEIKERGLKYNAKRNPDPNNDNYSEGNLNRSENNNKYDKGESYVDKIGFNFQTPIAGKTGTTNNFTDAWFVGFTPQVAIGVWVGMDNPAISIGKYGSKAALPIFAYSMKNIYDYGKYSLGNDKVRKLDENLDWSVPEDKIETLIICNKSKLIAKKGCYSSSREFFLKESLPQGKCDIPSHTYNYK